tara:strand:+ start:4280 stop:4402 length:123 start_codon:yes stop_codon:yes gene_type:complete
MVSKTNGRIWKLEVAVEQLKKEINELKKIIEDEMELKKHG